MPTPPEFAQMTVRATREAVLECGRDFVPLTRAITIACVAVWREGQSIDRNLPLAEQDARLMRSAELALAKAMAADSNRVAMRPHLEMAA